LQRNTHAKQLSALRTSGTVDEVKVAELRSAKDAIDVELDLMEVRVADLTVEQARDDAADRLAREVYPTGAAGQRSATPSANGAAPMWRRSNDGKPAAVPAGQRFAEHGVVATEAARNAGREEAVIGQHGSFGGLIRSMSTTSGSALVPTIWSADIIDRARNNAAVIKAGATMVPMDAKVVQIGRLTADPTASFRTEGSTITASDPTFDNVTLTANTLSALVVGSIEWFQDAPNVDEVVSEAVGKAVALQLDLTGLFGGMTTGSEAFSLATPPNPRGILATLLAVASSSVLGAGTNGTAQTALSYWNEVLDTIYGIKDFNENPNALIWPSKLARQYAKAYDSQGRILTPPPDVDAIEKYVSNQIPSFTQGTMTSRATDLFVGDFTELIIGQRLDFQVQTLVERYAELGQVGILATWRGDVQLARPRAFSVYRYLQGA